MKLNGYSQARREREEALRSEHSRGCKRVKRIQRFAVRHEARAAEFAGVARLIRSTEQPKRKQVRVTRKRQAWSLERAQVTAVRPESRGSTRGQGEVSLPGDGSLQSVLVYLFE